MLNSVSVVPRSSWLPILFPRCAAHGPMCLRSPNHQTLEQACCGVWYDCVACRTSGLISSSQLQQQLAEQSVLSMAATPMRPLHSVLPRSRCLR